MLTQLPDRKMSLSEQKNNVVYTDASGGGGVSIGTVIAVHNSTDSKLPAYSGEAPSWCKDENIYTLEILAACLGAAHLAALRGRGPSIFFIDNEAACAAIVRGTSDHDLPRLLIGAFWRICIESRICPWIERVSSQNNPADEPSRGPVHQSELCQPHDFPEPAFLRSRRALEKFANWRRDK